jgi:hypothetical protein
MEELIVIKREICGIPLWLIEEYLRELGGVSISPGHVDGHGWSVELQQIEAYQIGSLFVGQVLMIIKGTEAALDELLPGLDQKTLRAGG